MSVQILQCSPADIPKIADQMTRIYGAAFSQPPYNETPQVMTHFGASIRDYARRAGFICLIALEEAASLEESVEGEILGFTYGYTAQPGQWWHDTVTESLPPAQVERWFNNCFELVDLAVLPAEQQKGIGTRLFDELIARLPHRSAALTTMAAETPALQLYQKRGWELLHPELTFPSIDRTYYLMGKAL